jgi:rhamnosyl/mannosyltransferase
MKALIVSKYFYPVVGGIESVAYHVARNLVKSRVEVTVLASDEHYSSERMEGIRVLRLPTLCNIGNTPVSPGVFRKILSEDFDVCHLHEPNPFQNFLAYLALKLRRKPYVITYHSDIVAHSPAIALFKPFYWLFQRFFLLPGAAAIMPTSPNYVGISDILPAFRRKITVVPNGVDLDQYYPGKARRGRDVLFAGRLIYYKGLDYLLKAMPAVLKAVPDARLVIAGNGPLRQELQALAAKLGISTSVSWLGRYTDDQFRGLCQGCGVFVLPSIHKTEAFGIVLLEAMACGAPVITTDISGTEYAVRGAGIVVRPKDSGQLAEAITSVLKDQDAASSMSKKSLDKARGFEWKKIAAMVLDAYRKAAPISSRR